MHIDELSLKSEGGHAMMTVSVPAHQQEISIAHSAIEGCAIAAVQAWNAVRGDDAPFQTCAPTYQSTLMAHAESVFKGGPAMGGDTALARFEREVARIRGEQVKAREASLLAEHESRRAFNQSRRTGNADGASNPNLPSDHQTLQGEFRDPAQFPVGAAIGSPSPADPAPRLDGTANPQGIHPQEGDHFDELATGNRDAHRQNRPEGIAPNGPKIGELESEHHTPERQQVGVSEAADGPEQVPSFDSTSSGHKQTARIGKGEN